MLLSEFGFVGILGRFVGFMGKFVGILRGSLDLKPGAKSQPLDMPIVRLPECGQVNRVRSIFPPC